MSKWSDLKRSDKLFITGAAETFYNVYVREQGRKPDTKARSEIAKIVRAKAEERGITLRRSILDNHIDKFLMRLVRGKRDKPIPRSLKPDSSDKNVPPA